MSRPPGDQAIRTLRQELDKEREHREAITRDRDRLRRLTTPSIKYIQSQYRSLERLLVLLGEALDAQDPVKGRMIDASSPLVRTNGLRISDEGAATRRDRRRVERWSKRIDKLVWDFTQEIGGPLLEDEKPVKRKCWRKACEGKGRVQPYGVSNCRWCGREFGDG